MENVAYIPVKDVIKILCRREGDNNLSMADMYETYLAPVYNDIRFGVTKRTVTKKYYLDLTNNSLVLPNDCLLVVGLGYYDDCGNVKPMWYNNKIPAPMLFENSRPCSCATCGEENTSCGLIKEFDIVEEVVNILGDNYTNYVKTTVLTDGTVIKSTRTWGTESSSDEVSVVPFDTEEEVCVLDTLECGCIATTPTNTTKITELCTTCSSFNTGCGTYNAGCCETTAVNSYRLDIQGRLLIMSPNYNKDYVILKYVTATNTAEDFQIPTLALEAVLRGIKYYRSLDDAKAPAFTRGQNSMTHRAYTAELNKLKRRLNPTNWDKLMDSLGIMSTKKQYKNW